MATQLDMHTLAVVFDSRPDILSSIQQAADTPAHAALFNEIARFVYGRLTSAGPDDEPATKRRRVDGQPHINGEFATRGRLSGAGSEAATLNADAAVADPVLLEVKDISMTAPHRKKYDLCFTKNFLYARATGGSIPVQGTVYPWKDIEHAFYLPVPDKSQAQFNYVLLPRESYLPTSKQSNTNPGAKQQPPEPLVFTIPGGAPRPGCIAGPSAKTAEAVSDTYSSLFHWALTTSMRSAGNHSCQLVSSDPRIFHSVARQAHRPNEKAVHVKAFRGSKDGFLFFLPTGILWGFKKPIVFVPLDRIMAVSYTNVLRTTFNMVVELDSDAARDGGNAIEKEIEFGMIDQEDYQGIDETYVRRHGLADRSMAEQRKAKRELAENSRKPAAGDDDNGDDTGAENLTELERAQREAEQRLQDEEDELEEDYDPEADSEVDSSGSDEDDGEGEGEFDNEGEEDEGEGLEEDR
ncbi:hypothetical protein VTK26DRAFT_8856 [Humicola hyalothermophila]